MSLLPRRHIKKIQMDRDKSNLEISRKDHLNARLQGVDAFNLASFLSKDELKVDWSARRKRIDLSLIFLGVLISIIIVSLIVAVFYNKTMDPNFSYVFSGALMFLLFSFVGIIGAYLIGPAFESAAYRKVAGNMYNNMVNAQFGNRQDSTPPVTATTTTNTTVSQGQENGEPN